MQTATLAHATDLVGFRQAARRLVAQNVAPDQVIWEVVTADDSPDLFGQAEPVKADTPDDNAKTRLAPKLTVPSFFPALCEYTALHADPARFALLYRLLWRLQREPGLRHDPLDPDRMAAEHMARAVRRDMHKMTAFVRFRPLAEGDAQGWHVAWFEPAHHIVEATAPFFCRRFAQMRWAILTPQRSAHWDGHALTLGPGARREDAPAADAGEALWLTYYAHIFNPARLKLKMMQKEMPRRYWHNLPEATLIQPLVAEAAKRSGRMVDQGASAPAHRRPASSEALRIVPAQSLTALPAAQAAQAASPALSWESLNHDLARCRACPIGACATQAVPGEGPKDAALMIVGEQPGDQEDLQGRPFVGPAGQLLDEAFRHLTWARDELYLTNAVKHFKFELRGKRRLHKTAAVQEAETCAAWLEAEIALLRPRAAIALGATAARALLGPGIKVTASRGQWFARADGLRVLVTLHPSALLRAETGEREITRTAAFADWLRDLRQALPVQSPAAAPVTR